MNIPVENNMEAPTTMNLSLTQEQLEFKTEVREFVNRELKPKAAELDRTGEFPSELLQMMGQKGYLGIPIPEEYNGLGKDSISYLIALEELSRGCGAIGVITAVHTSVGTYPIYLFGTEEQKQKFVKPLARGEMLGAFALTEPAAGSDASAIATTAKRNGSERAGYTLNGGKVFITNGTSGDVAIVIAVTDSTKDHHGISAFIVEKGTPGFSYGEEETKMGLHGSEASELIFDNCEIPTENLLGAEGEGFKISMITLDGGRLGIAAQAIGVAQAAFEECFKFAQEHTRAGKPLSKNQSIQFALSDMATELEAARLLMYKAAYLKDQNKRYTQESAMAKVYASEVAMRVTNNASGIMGEFGYTRRSQVERLLRDIKVCEIYEGTSEIQRIVIAKQLLR